MLRFGISCQFRNAEEWFIPFDRFYEERLAIIAEADALGFDSIWLTEHHFVPDGYLPSPLVMSAAIAARTSHLEIGQGILIMPLYHPVRLAEDAAVIDNISGGRFMLGVGAGYRAEEFAGYGIERSARGQLMEEGLEILKRCWTEERFSFSGEQYTLRDVSVYPKPMRHPHPPLWVGSRSDAATRRAARFGCHLIPQRGYRQHMLYVETLRQHGYDPAEMRIERGLECIVTDDDPADVRIRIDEILQQHEYKYHMYHGWLAAAGDADVDKALAHQPPAPLELVIGTPEKIIDAIEKFVSRYFVTDVTVASIPMGEIPTWFTESIHRFAEEVIPHFRSELTNDGGEMHGDRDRVNGHGSAAPGRI